MNWIPVRMSLPPENANVIVTVKDLENKHINVVPCSYGKRIDPETAEIYNDLTFVYADAIDLNDKVRFRVLAWMPLPEPYPDYFRVIVAGSRSFEDYKLLKEKLNNIFAKRRPTSIVCGEAKGADKLGRKYAEENKITIDSYPANWNKHGKQAGYIRNEVMADNAEALVAFWDGKSAGTRHMIDTARSKGLQVRIIYFTKE